MTIGSNDTKKPIQATLVTQPMDCFDGGLTDEKLLFPLFVTWNGLVFVGLFGIYMYILDTTPLK